MSLSTVQLLAARHFSVTDARIDPKELAHWCFIVQSAPLSSLRLYSAPHKQPSPPFLSQPRPRIDDDIKIKQNHRPSLLLAFIIREKIRKRKGRRKREDGVCMSEWLRNPNSWRQCYVSPCLCFTLLPSFSSCHPDTHLFLDYTTNRPLFTMHSTLAGLISAGCKADLGGGHRDWELWVWGREGDVRRVPQGGGRKVRGHVSFPQA